MSVATKRAVIAAAAVAAAGLFGSLSNDGSLVAQSAAPVVHHDVALVDWSSDVAEAAAVTGPQATLLADEATLVDGLYQDVFGPTGLEETLYASLPVADRAEFLDTYGITGVLGTTAPADLGYTEIFNGSATQFFDGLYANGLVELDYLNQGVGITAAESQASILGLLNNDPFVNLGTGLTDPTVGANFDGDLLSIAQSSYNSAFTDFSGYLTYLDNNFTTLSADGFGLSTIGTIVTELSSGLQTVLTNSSTDLTTFLSDLGSLF